MHKETTAFHVPTSTKITDVRQYYRQIPCIEFWAKLENKCGMGGLKGVYAHKYVASFTKPNFIKLIIWYKFVDISAKEFYPDRV